MTTDAGEPLGRRAADTDEPLGRRAADEVVSDEDFAYILAQTRDFVRTAVVPREQEIMADNRVPDDIRDQAKKMGLFGYAIPQEWGGLGLNVAQDVELAMELGYTSLALRSMFGTNNGIAGQVLVGFGTDHQKARWLQGMASGEVVASFALTEPGAGSNPSGLRTKAIRDGAGEDEAWLISGQKRFITNAPVAQLFVVFARTRPADDNGPGIAVFLVPADAPGVEVGAKDAKMGQEGAWTADVSFADVRVGDSALVGGSEDIGYRAAMTSLARGRIHIAALAVGAAQRALDESVTYAATATQGGTPIGEFQLVAAMLADQQAGVMPARRRSQNRTFCCEALLHRDGRQGRRSRRSGPRRQRIHAGRARGTHLPRRSPAAAV
jgi:acyl-CoA dehydrogenase